MIALVEDATTVSNGCDNHATMNRKHLMPIDEMFRGLLMIIKGRCRPEQFRKVPANFADTEDY